MDTLVIDRAKWLTGRSNRISHLLDDDGMMCCLGFYCQSEYRGIMLDMDYPSSIANYVKAKREGGDYSDAISKRLQVLIMPDIDNELEWDDNVVVDSLIHINDDPGITDGQREWGVRWRFAMLGVNVNFEGDYPNNRNLIRDRRVSLPSEEYYGTKEK